MQRKNLSPEELTNSVDECEKKFKFLQTKNFELYSNANKIKASSVLYNHQKLVNEFFAASEKADSLKKFLGHPLLEKEFTTSVKTMLECKEKGQNQREVVEKMKTSIDIDYCKTLKDEWHAYSNLNSFLLNAPTTMLDHQKVVKLAHLFWGYNRYCHEYSHCNYIASTIKQFDENINKLDKIYKEWDDYTERLDSTILTEYRVQRLRNKLINDETEIKENPYSITKSLLSMMTNSGKSELKRPQPSIKEVKNIITLIHTDFSKKNQSLVILQ